MSRHSRGPEAYLKPAFTLVELLVVMAITAMLIALLMPALSKSRAVVDKMKCLNTMRQMGVSSQLYLTDFRRYNPFSASHSNTLLSGPWPKRLFGLNYVAHAPGNRNGSPPGSAAIWDADINLLSSFWLCQSSPFRSPGMRVEFKGEMMTTPTVQLPRPTMWNGGFTGYGQNSNLSPSSDGVYLGRTSAQIDKVKSPGQLATHVDGGFDAGYGSAGSGGVVQYRPGRVLPLTGTAAGLQYEMGFWHGGSRTSAGSASGNAVFADGHAESLSPAKALERAPSGGSGIMLFQ